MQKINYSEKIKLENKINELVMINIDEKLEQTNETECIKVSGEIKISGQANTDIGVVPFDKGITIDIILDREQLIQDKVNISVDDFNYTIEDNIININLIMKIDGLKEIEAFFPPQEDQEDVEIEETPIEERIDTEETIEEKINSTNETIINEDTETIDETNEEEMIVIDKVENDEDYLKESKKENNKFSLINQVFKNRSIKKETSYKLHVVKTETSYQEIANLYNIDLEKLRKANNDEEIYIGKLIFIPN